MKWKQRSHLDQEDQEFICLQSNIEYWLLLIFYFFYYYYFFCDRPFAANGTGDLNVRDSGINIEPGWLLKRKEILCSVCLVPELGYFVIFLLLFFLAGEQKKDGHHYGSKSQVGVTHDILIS